MMNLRLVKGWPQLTIQGEGVLVGVPSVFLRTAGCDLRCHLQTMPGHARAQFWNCDTPESLKDYDHRAKRFLPTLTKHAYEAEVYDVARQLHEFGCRHIVITGGEPMLQADALKEMLRFLQADEWATDLHVTVETNCRTFHRDLARCINLASLSPKLQQIADTGWNHSVERETLTKWLGSGAEHIQVKIVCSTVEEYDMANAVFSFVQAISRADCIVSIADAPHTNPKSIIEAVLRDRKYRMQTQMHKVMQIP